MGVDARGGYTRVPRVFQGDARLVQPAQAGQGLRVEHGDFAGFQVQRLRLACQPHGTVTVAQLRAVPAQRGQGLGVPGIGVDVALG